MTYFTKFNSWSWDSKGTTHSPIIIAMEDRVEARDRAIMAEAIREENPNFGVRFVG
jgi:hypothetical protein